MPPKEKRIPRDLFKEITNNSNSPKKIKFLNTPLFSLKVANSTEKYARVAVSVSKKISKKAVVRNRTRRRLYSALSSLLPNLKTGYYILSAKQGSETHTVKDIQQNLQKALEKESLIEK